MGEGAIDKITQQSDEVSYSVRADVGRCERISLLFWSKQRNPAVFRPFDEWHAGGDGDELRWELSRPTSILWKKRRGNSVSQRSSSSVGYLSSDHLLRASASVKWYRIARERKRLAHVHLSGSPSHTSLWSHDSNLAVLVLLCHSSECVVDRCVLQNEYPRHLPFFPTLLYCIGNVCWKKIYRQCIVPRFLYLFLIIYFFQKRNMKFTKNIHLCHCWRTKNCFSVLKYCACVYDLALADV